VPISVTNKIDDSATRVACDDINNPLLPPDQINATAANAAVGVLFAPGDSTQVDVSSDADDSNGMGGVRPEAVPQDGMGGAASLRWSGAAGGLALLSTAFVFFV
jgi:hypothetical protein